MPDLLPIAGQILPANVSQIEVCSVYKAMTFSVFTSISTKNMYLRISLITIIWTAIMIKD